MNSILVRFNDHGVTKTIEVEAMATPVPGLVINATVPGDETPAGWVVTHHRSGLALFAHEHVESLAGAVLDLAGLADWTMRGDDLYDTPGLGRKVCEVADRWSCLMRDGHSPDREDIA